MTKPGPVKKFFLDVLEVLDTARIVPRIILIAYGIMLWETHRWFIMLDAPLDNQALYVKIVYGAAAAIGTIYMSTGRNWDIIRGGAQSVVERAQALRAAIGTSTAPDPSSAPTAPPAAQRDPYEHGEYDDYDPERDER